MDINEITPMDALNKMQKWKKAIQNADESKSSRITGKGTKNDNPSLFDS